jgi:hypothetical protein
MTNKEMAARLAAIQEDAYMRFHVNSLPQDADTLDDMSEWTLDQIKKVSFADMLNEDVLDMLDDGSLASACLATYLGLER